MNPEDPAAALAEENALLSRQLDRERRIRWKAEDIAERGLRELYQSRHELAFLSEITTMANQAGSAREALAPALEYMCHFTGWPAAHAHVITDDGLDRDMRPSNIWYCDPAVDISELRTSTAEHVFAKGEGLPGRVWESGTPVWLEDIAGCDNFPRRDAAVRSGIRAAFSTPLMIGPDVAGALEFFNPNPMPEDTGLLALMARAGTQLGRLLERDAASARLTSALAHSEQISALLRTKIDTMMDPQAMIEPIRDSNGQIVDFVCVDANRAACREFGLPLHEVRGRRHLELFPDAANSGFSAMFTRCVEDGESISFDEVPYGQDLPGGVRYYDIRAVRIGSESVNTTWRDVTERARLSRDLARALADSERAHALARANTDALMDPQVLLEGVRDARGRIVDLIYRDVNVATCLDIGLSRDELIGHSCLESRPKLRGSGLLAHVIDCLENRRPLVLDDVLHQNEPSDPMRYYDVRASYAGADSISITWRDVTARVTAAQRIAESEERFRLLAENAGDVVVHVRDGRFVWISPSVEAALGMPADYWTGREVQEMTVPEDRRLLAVRLREVVETGQLATRARAVAADGGVHWIALHAKTFFDAAGRPDGITGSFRVVDEEVEAIQQAKQARRRQAEADARFRKVTENSAVGMCLLTPDGRFEFVNQALCDFLGYDAPTLQRKTWQQVTAPDSLTADLANVDEILAGRLERYRMTNQYIHADGRTIWGDLSVGCLRDESGQVECFVSQIIDITDQVTTRRQLAQQHRYNQSLTELLEAQAERLRAELTVAETYVRTILPGDLAGPVPVSQRYLPSSELSGDCFDYHWLDDDHLMVYLIDVSGHGIASALVAISVHNLMGSGSATTGTRKLHWLLDPAQVLTELNGKFPMDQHGGNYFTMWYGVYQASTRTLHYAGGGHPPALVFADSVAEPVQLGSQGLPIGMFPDSEFRTDTYTVPPGAKLLLYSDGAFELPHPDGGSWSLSDFNELCRAAAKALDWNLDQLTDRLTSRSATGQFDDDCSLVLLRFD